MKITLTLLMILPIYTCIAQTTRLPASHQRSTFRASIANATATESERQIPHRANFSMKKKIKSGYPIPVQKSQIYLIDSIYMWQWDSISADWALDYKYSPTQYDANYNVLSELGQYWDGDVWVNSDQAFATYDDQNNLLSTVWQLWTDDKWENDEKDNYEYDVNHNLLTESVAYWDGSTWINSMLITYTYDVNGNETSYLHQDWNGTDWENYWQEIYTYDVHNNFTSSTRQDWNGDEWVDNSRNTYVYDDNNRLISSVTQTDNDAELVTSEVTYIYDEENRLKNDSTHAWGNTWEYWYLGTYTHDSNGNLINWLLQEINGDNLEFVTRTIFTYDAANNRTSQFRQDWKDNYWVNLDFDRHSYNQFNLLLSDAYKYWNSSGTKILDGDSTFYYYSNAVTGIKEIERGKEDINIYPNPASGKFTLNSNRSIQSVVIFNMNGDLIYSDSGSKQQKQKVIDLSGCDKGVYLVKIRTSKGIDVAKLLLQ